MKFSQIIANIVILATVSTCLSNVGSKQSIQRLSPTSTRLYLSNFDQLSVKIYDAQLDISNSVATIITEPSLLGCAALVSAGLLSALSPCCLSMIPITTLYLASSSGSEKNVVLLSSATSELAVADNRKLIRSLLYALGLAFTFTSLGLIASVSGRIFNPNETVGHLTTLLTAAFSIFMGLNLLEIIRFTLPTLDISSVRRNLNLPWQIEPFVVGISAALVLSPCTSPVLASLLAAVGASGQPVLGGLYLLAYSAGYAVVPVAAANTGLIAAQASAEKFQWVNPLFGGILISGGTYVTLDALNHLLTDI